MCPVRPQYNPAIGRFLTEDTYRGDSKDPLSLNLYTYCRNSPINHVDLSGHDPTPVWAQNINSGKGTEEDYRKAFEVYENGTAGAWAGSAGNVVNKAIENALIYYAESSKQNSNRRPNVGEPGSTYTAPNGDTRTYGSDGNPEKDVDTGHPNHHPEIGSPHGHDWKNGVRGPAYKLPIVSNAGTGVDWAKVGENVLGFVIIVGGIAYFVYTGDPSMIDQGVKSFQ